MIATPCHSFVSERRYYRVSGVVWFAICIVLLGALLWGIGQSFSISASSDNLTRLPSNASTVHPSIEFISVNGYRRDGFFEFSGVCRNVSNSTFTNVAVYVELIDSKGYLRDVDLQPIYINPLLRNGESPFKVIMPYISGISGYRVFVCGLNGKSIPSR